MPMKASMIKVEGKTTLRVFVERGNLIFKLCQLFFRQKDASIYVVPYAKNGRFFMGVNSFEGKEIQKNFDLGKHPSVDETPHLSIHEKGQIHIRATDGSKTGPLMIKNLSHLRGEHIASVIPDSFEALPVQNEEITGGKKIQNIIVCVSPNEFSRRVLLCVNGLEPKFGIEDSYSLLRIKLQRPTLEFPLHIGIFTVPQEPLGPINILPGVTVLGGWNPENSNDFLSIRGN